ncbi:MAG: PadR family transcriptional regulator [Candidatus Methanofastidiosa archaeon]|nr:PadR family transcriptional regulator [Candidatus Methanofastidiosa archaeon]
MWIYVLKLLEKRPMYGYELKDEIEKNFGWAPATVTSYVVLYKLESEDYVKTEVREENSNKTKRKYYIITEKGSELLKQGCDFIRETLEKLENSEMV